MSPDAAWPPEHYCIRGCGRAGDRYQEGVGWFCILCAADVIIAAYRARRGLRVDP